MVYKTPGVYVEEISKFPPSIAAVETAIPAFIGYTEMAKLKEDDDLLLVPRRITSMLEYERFFGGAQPEAGITVTINTTKSPVEIQPKIDNPSNYKMFYAMQAYFTNGGGPCYIVSVGDYSAAPVVVPDSLLQGLEEVAKIDEVTLLVFPDSTGITSPGDYYAVHKESIDQCVSLQDRFAVIDIYMTPDPDDDDIQIMRDTLSGTVDELKYGATYYPYLETRFDYLYNADAVVVNVDGNASTLAELESTNNALFNQAKNAIGQLPVVLPPSSSVVGIYATTDNNRGVWKAPANVNIDSVIRPLVKITDKSQEGMNVDSTAGKSVNAIRSFTGRGPAIIWGARTLAGNDNEWRYISVRRFFNFVEESVKKATVQFVFEPNDVNTWTRVKSMIENFLILQWRAGALMGTTPEQGFFVKVGLNETMTELDVLEGRMIVEIGMAVVRPAEFIILKFSHKMLQES